MRGVVWVSGTVVVGTVRGVIVDAEGSRDVAEDEDEVVSCVEDLGVKKVECVVEETGAGPVNKLPVENLFPGVFKFAIALADRGVTSLNQKVC